MDHPDQIAQATRKPGLRIPRIDQGPALSLAGQGTSAFETIQLALDRIERHCKIPGRGPTVGFAVVKYMQKHGFRRSSAEQILQCGER